MCSVNISEIFRFLFFFSNSCIFFFLTRQKYCFLEILTPPFIKSLNIFRYPYYYEPPPFIKILRVLQVKFLDFQKKNTPFVWRLFCMKSTLKITYIPGLVLQASMSFLFALSCLEQGWHHRHSQCQQP